MKHYKKIIKGASFTGVAIAMEDPKNTLIIEDSILVGKEFIDALRFDNIDHLPNNNPFIQSLSNKLLEGNIQNNEYVYMPDIHPILMEFIQNQKIHINFSTIILSKRKKEDNTYIIETICRNNIQRYTADIWIDTSDYMILNRQGFISNRYLNALMVGNFLHYDHDGFRTVSINKDDLFILEMECSKQLTYTSACKKIIEFINNVSKYKIDAKLLSIANSFCIRAKGLPIIEGNEIYVPSVSSLNFYDAITNGTIIGRRLC